MAAMIAGGRILIAHCGQAVKLLWSLLSWGSCPRLTVGRFEKGRELRGKFMPAKAMNG